MKSPIIFFASVILGSGLVQGSSIQYEHEMGLRSTGKYLKVFWSDGEGYEVTYNKIRFEFDSTGKLTQTLFGGNKYELGATSEPCNVPEGVDYTGGVVETRGSDKSPYTCSQCEVVVQEACGDGIKQICDYTPGVVDNPPFNKWAVNSFSTMCKQLYAACDAGRVEAECGIKCSASDPPTLKPEVCPDVPVGDGVCERQLEIVFERQNTGTEEDILFEVTEPGGSVVTLDLVGGMGEITKVVTPSDVVITYTMFNGLMVSPLGSYGIAIRSGNIGSASYAVQVRGLGVVYAVYSGELASNLSADYTADVVSYDDDVDCPVDAPQDQDQ